MPIVSLFNYSMIFRLKLVEEILYYADQNNLVFSFSINRLPITLLSQNYAAAQHLRLALSKIVCLFFTIHSKLVCCLLHQGGQ